MKNDYNKKDEEIYRKFKELVDKLDKDVNSFEKTKEVIKARELYKNNSNIKSLEKINFPESIKKSENRNK